MIRSGPSFAAAFSSNPKARSRSVRHTFRPSTTPNDNMRPWGADCQRPIELFGRTHQVEVHRCHGQTEHRRQMVEQIAKIRGQTKANLVRRRTQPGAGRLATPPETRQADRGPAPAHRSAPSRPRRGRAAREFPRRRAATCPRARAASVLVCTCPTGAASAARATPAACGTPAPPLLETA